MSDYSWAETYDPLYAAQKTVIDQNVLPYHLVPNFEGTPTQFYDEQGLRGILTSDGKVYDVRSFNPIVSEGQKITGETPIQSVDPEGNLVFLRDPNDPESVTTQPTPYPLAGGTLAGQAYMRPIRRGGGGIFGTILGDFSSAVKDPYFRNFALAAGAMAGAAALAPSLGTAGGTGISGSTAGGFLGGPGEILPGAVGTGGGSLGAAGTDIVGSTAGGFLGGPGEILPGAVGTGGGSLGATTGLTPMQTLRLANLARSGISTLTSGLGGASGLANTLGSLALPAGALAAALAASRDGQNIQPVEQEPIPELTLDWGYQYTPNERPGVAMSQQYLNPRFFQEGGLSSLEDIKSPLDEKRVIPADIMDEVRQIVNDESPSQAIDAYRTLLENITSRQPAVLPRFNYEPSIELNPNIGVGNLGVSIPVGRGIVNADVYGSRSTIPDYKRDGLDAVGLGYEMPVGEGKISANVQKYLNAPGIGGMLNYERRFALGGNVGAPSTPPTDGVIKDPSDVLGPLNRPSTMPHYPMQGLYQGYAAGGLSDLGAYSDGGRMLKGPGDGMSDSIPANIEGKRPARLATDEFVVPADVVSHLGNGSSDAGAKVLYSMMDRVRKARTGQKKQGKQINPNKFMPV